MDINQNLVKNFSEYHFGKEIRTCSIDIFNSSFYFRSKYFDSTSIFKRILTIQISNWCLRNSTIQNGYHHWIIYLLRIGFWNEICKNFKIGQFLFYQLLSWNKFFNFNEYCMFPMCTWQVFDVKLWCEISFMLWI